MSGLAFRTGKRSAHVAPVASGLFAGLEIQERLDAARAKRSVSCVMVDSPGLFGEAKAWAEKAGFAGSQLDFAASTALLLRSVRGAGNVTREMVCERMRLAWPDLFQDETNDIKETQDV